MLSNGTKVIRDQYNTNYLLVYFYGKRIGRLKLASGGWKVDIENRNLQSNLRACKELITAHQYIIDHFINVE